MSVEIRTPSTPVIIPDSNVIPGSGDNVIPGSLAGSIDNIEYYRLLHIQKSNDTDVENQIIERQKGFSVSGGVATMIWQDEDDTYHYWPENTDNSIWKIDTNDEVVLKSQTRPLVITRTDSVNPDSIDVVADQSGFTGTYLKEVGTVNFREYWKRTGSNHYLYWDGSVWVLSPNTSQTFPGVSYAGPSGTTPIGGYVSPSNPSDLANAAPTNPTQCPLGFRVDSATSQFNGCVEVNGADIIATDDIRLRAQQVYPIFDEGSRNQYELAWIDKTNRALNTTSSIYTDAAGNLHVDADIVQNGSSYETHVEQLYTKKDTIILRDGAVGGLGPTEYTGLIAKLYDGVNDGQLVWGADGYARVGDVGNLVILAGRDVDVNWTNGNFPEWDDTNKIFIDSGISSGALGNYVLKAGDSMTGILNMGVAGLNVIIGSGGIAQNNYIEFRQGATAYGYIGSNSDNSDVRIVTYDSRSTRIVSGHLYVDSDLTVSGAITDSGNRVVTSVNGLNGPSVIVTWQNLGGDQSLINLSGFNNDAGFITSSDPKFDDYVLKSGDTMTGTLNIGNSGLGLIVGSGGEATNNYAEFRQGVDAYGYIGANLANNDFRLVSYDDRNICFITGGTIQLDSNSVVNGTLQINVANNVSTDQNKWLQLDGPGIVRTVTTEQLSSFIGLENYVDKTPSATQIIDGGGDQALVVKRTSSTTGALIADQLDTGDIQNWRVGGDQKCKISNAGTFFTEAGVEALTRAAFGGVLDPAYKLRSYGDTKVDGNLFVDGGAVIGKFSCGEWGASSSYASIGHNNYANAETKFQTLYQDTGRIINSARDNSDNEIRSYGGKILLQSRESEASPNNMVSITGDYTGSAYNWIIAGSVSMNSTLNTGSTITCPALNATSGITTNGLIISGTLASNSSITTWDTTAGAVTSNTVTVYRYGENSIRFRSSFTINGTVGAGGVVMSKSGNDLDLVASRQYLVAFPVATTGSTLQTEVFVVRYTGTDTRIETVYGIAGTNKIYTLHGTMMDVGV